MPLRREVMQFCIPLLQRQFVFPFASSVRRLLMHALGVLASRGGAIGRSGRGLPPLMLR
jgi:hypothetical protein